MKHSYKRQLEILKSYEEMHLRVQATSWQDSQTQEALLRLTLLNQEAMSEGSERQQMNRALATIALYNRRTL